MWDLIVLIVYGGSAFEHWHEMVSSSQGLTDGSLEPIEGHAKAADRENK